MKKSDFKVDKLATSVEDLGAETRPLDYWLAKSPKERLEALEFMRQINYDYDPVSDRISKVLEIAERISG